MTNNKTQDTLQQNQDQVLGSGKMLGCITYWSLKGFKVRRDEFKASLKGMGLDAAYGRDMSPKACLTKALEQFSRGSNGEYGTKRVKVGGGVALLHYSVNTSGKVEATHMWTVKATGTGIEFERRAQAATDIKLEAQNTMAKKMQDAFDDVVAYASTSDLSNVLTAAMAGTRKEPMLSACNLRGEAGGVYFVPQAKYLNFCALRTYIQSNSASVVSRFFISDQADNAAEVSTSVKNTVESELLELRQQVREFAKECASGTRKAGQKALNARAKRYDDLAAKVDLWADMLGGCADEMRGKITEASAALASELGVKPAEQKPEAAAAPDEPDEPAQLPEAAPTFHFCCAIEEETSLDNAERARKMAGKIKSAGAETYFHYAKKGDVNVGIVEVVDHPVMGTGSLTFKPGSSPEFKSASRLRLTDEVRAALKTALEE